MVKYPGSDEKVEGVESRNVHIWSDGTRMSGTLFLPPDFDVKDKRPALILCHGWGGLREHFNVSYAPWFAGAGFVVLTFDYRGWGDSDSRLVIKGSMPKPDAHGEVKVRAQAIRELVDPRDMTEDIKNCLDFITGEPGVDPEKIGLWGTSYGGGNAVFVAAHDERVKCLATQISSMNSTAVYKNFMTADELKKQMIMRARGEIDPVPQGTNMAMGMQGTPHLARMSKYIPVFFADRLKCPVLVIDAEKETLFDIRQNGGLVYERAKNNVPARYEIIQGMTHVDIYDKGLKQTRQMAIDWFITHLAKS